MSKPEWGRRRSDNQPYPKSRDKDVLPRNLEVIIPPRAKKQYVVVVELEEGDSKVERLLTEKILDIVLAKYGGERVGDKYIIYANSKWKREMIKNEIYNVDPVSPENITEAIIKNGRLIEDEGFEAFERGETEGLWKIIFVPHPKERHPEYPKKKYGQAGTLVKKFKTYNEAVDYHNEQPLEVRKRLHLIKPTWVRS